MRVFAFNASMLGNPSQDAKAVFGVVNTSMHGIPCEYCRSDDGVGWEDSRTSYASPPPLNRFQRILGIEPEDPNKPVWLCRPCAKEHHAYWTERWDEYYSQIF